MAYHTSQLNLNFQFKDISKKMSLRGQVWTLPYKLGKNVFKLILQPIHLLSWYDQH